MKTNRIFFPNFHLNLIFKLSSSIFKRLTIFNPSSFIFHLSSSIFKRLTIFNPSSLIFHLILIFNLSSLILISSCSKKGTDPGEETVTFSGKVTLEGQTDHSGVTIALYKPVELDTALVRINRQYPNIGVQISQKTEFDHREHTPVVTTVSDAGGNWKIENVAQGEYNVVASKDGFGWQYHTGKNANQNVTVANSQLLLVEELSQPIYNNYIFQSNRTYRISSNTVFNTPTFGDSVNFIVEAAIKFSGNSTLSLTLKNLKFIGNSSNSRVDFENYSSITLRNITFLLVVRGLRLINIPNANLINIIVSKTEDPIYCNQITGLNIINSLFKEATRGVEILGSSNCLLSENIIVDVTDGLEFTSSEAELTRNYFKQGDFGVLAHADNIINITNNVFDDNAKTCIVFMGCEGNILKNYFKGSSEVFLSINSEYIHQFFQQPTVKINYNNLLINDQTLGLSLDKNGSVAAENGFTSEDIDAASNFWNFNSEVIIKNKIVDNEDKQPLGIVHFIPYTNAPIDSTGIN